jgi:hypothetical protein
MYVGGDMAFFQVIFAVWELVTNLGGAIIALLATIALWRNMKAQQATAASLERIERILMEGRGRTL